MIGGGEIHAALGPARAAVFILATLLLTLSAILLPTYPAALHSIPLHLNWENYRQMPAAGRTRHRLEIDRDGQMTLDGRRMCDLLDLRQEFDVMANTQGPILEVLPDPELRHGRFVEIMAIARRANIMALDVDLQPGVSRAPAGPPPAACRERLVL